jgi:hypothetical protein
MHFVYGFCDGNALRHRIFAAAEHMRNHPDSTASATQFLWTRAENYIATGGGH